MSQKSLNWLHCNGLADTLLSAKIKYTKNYIASIGIGLASAKDVIDDFLSFFSLPASSPILTRRLALGS
jgi:hypothetical protein